MSFVRSAPQNAAQRRRASERGKLTFKQPEFTGVKWLKQRGRRIGLCSRQEFTDVKLFSLRHR